jgi:acyl carrier protein
MNGMDIQNTDVFTQVSVLLADRFLMTPAEITESTDFEHDLEMDSIDAIDLLIAVNELFKVQIPEDTLPEIHTVGHLVAVIEKHRQRIT